MPATIEKINKERQGIMKNMGTFLNSLNRYDVDKHLDEDDLQYYNKQADECRKEFVIQQSLSYGLCVDGDPAAIALQSAFMDRHRKITKKTMQIQRLITAAANPGGSGNNTNTNSNATVDIRLPYMEIPKFSGNYVEWTSFHDLYLSVIHTNMKLSKSQKFQYLKKSLEGEAAEVIQSLTLSDANYDDAWDLLIKRYENKRHVINIHLDSLYGMRQSTQESATDLRALLDTSRKHIRALRGLQADNWETVIVHLLTAKMAPDTRTQWALQSPGNDYPKYADLDKFIDQRCMALMAGGQQVQPNQVHGHRKPNSNFNHAKSKGTSAYHTSTSSSSSSTTASATKCPACPESHALFRCHGFGRMNAQERRSFVQKVKLCFNCMGSGHAANQCFSTRTCKVCNGKHHTMLHLEKSQDTPVATVTSHYSASGVPVLLSTAEVKVKTSSGQFVTCRALLDNGSQASFVTESFAQLLGLKRQRSTVHVKGIGDSGSDRARGMVKMDLHSKTSDFHCSPQLIILPKLTGFIPDDLLDKKWPHLEGLQLADPHFNKPGKIDVLLGADIYNTIIKEGRVTVTDQPSAQNSHFGWVISGPANSPSAGEGEIYSHITITDVDKQLERFWELEELSDRPNLTADEVQCETHFQDTHTRDETGRYVVALPFKDSNQVLGSSKEQAIKRFFQVERRLERNPHHREQYNKFMQEYEKLGHMELIPPHERTEIPGKSFYLPHHFVLKETSTSTKFRVVFDGSARSTSDTSLNDILLVGPRLQNDIMDILMRFRTHKHAFTADIGKFFRQFKMATADRDFQRIVWRGSPKAPLQEYRLATVTYGTASAPFLASRSLHQLASDCGHQYPLAKEVMVRDAYVDDIMSGANDVATALSLQQQLTEVLGQAQLPLLKWASNCPEILMAVPPEQRETQLPLLVDTEDSVKALGLYWNPASDYFSFKVNLDPNVKTVTKRTLLSDTAKLYDPLGLLAPVIINAKIMFQELWKEKLGWDDELPPDLRHKWLEFRQGLVQLEKLKIKRPILNNIHSSHQLHGFCDASMRAYDAAVYLRTQDPDGHTEVNLICSKSKVAPVKQVSLPRLELCGAVLLARLLKRVSSVLNINLESTTAWTDSTIVLDWLSHHPQRWEIFVANRVSEIQGLFSREKWRHVPSEDNPADCASRGLSPAELLEFDLWWHGPSWLVKDASYWPTFYSTPEQSTPIPGERKQVFVFTVIKDEFDLTLKYSSLTRLQRITGFCLLFIRNCRLKKEERQSSLSTTDLHHALKFWVRRVQEQEFSTIFTALRAGKPVPSQFAALNLFIDPDGLLRVGGRLTQSSLAYQRKHPWLLPQRHAFTDLVIRREHERLLHAGGQLTQSAINNTFWIVNAKRAIRKNIRSCIKCFRFNAASCDQIMGNLPASRLEPCRAFLRTGVDFGGPFTLKSLPGRGGKLYKAYISLFICFVTKAIHIELVTDLSTDAFLAAFKRFIARRGRPAVMHSDNGTNFIGANNELKHLYQQFRSQQHQTAITDYLVGEGIKWQFIPPRAPHHGGLWEAGIKSAKQHMRKIIGESCLTYEEFTTVLHQIEACLNSRPISPMSTDPNDLQPLTPGHFLIGDALTSIPEPDLTEIPRNRLGRYQLLQQQLQLFWKRWSHEYLDTVQQRTKWKTEKPDISIGDLVLIIEDNLPPLKWMMARIIATKLGTDKHPRVATLKTSTGELQRDIRRLCKLPIETVEADASRAPGCLGM